MFRKRLPERVTVGKTTRTQGRKGELFAQILTEFPHRFQSLKTVSLQDSQENSATLTLEYSWLHKGGIVLKFAGVDTIDAAKAWVGCLVQIEHEELLPLPEGTFYWFQLQGCDAFDEAGVKVGHVRHVEDHAGNTLLVLETEEGREILVPTSTDFLLDVDTENKRIALRLPEELIRLNS